ncbi:MAG: sialate O-acetylesterase, partial [Chitinophaga rupis]
PSLLYNAMIHPITSFGIKGVIWYQGENNAVRAYQYRKAMPLLIEDWRHQWKEGIFPFYYVQLASYDAAGGNSNKGSSWAELREAQALALSLPHTGMAVTIDIGESHDIHPRDKQDVGARLAALALKYTYGLPIVATGPSFSTLTITGDKAAILMTKTGSPLEVRGDHLHGFEIAGADRKFYTATATLNKDQIVVRAAEVSSPVAVRYAWADDAGTANLFNKAGFPAAPFRTDHWTEMTHDVKYHITF